MEIIVQHVVFVSCPFSDCTLANYLGIIYCESLCILCIALYSIAFPSLLLLYVCVLASLVLPFLVSCPFQNIASSTIM